MDLEISTSKPRGTSGEYVHSGEVVFGPLLPSAMPPPSILLKKENEPWRGPVAFGMANILNRSHQVSAPPTAQSQPSALPKFSLPSLHSFGKPLITKQEPSMNRVRSILNDAPPTTSMPVAVLSDGNVTSTSESSPLTTSQTPADLNETPRKTAPSRRIAPAPTDDDDGGEEDGGADSIRGGRWSSEEHDRFLAGFRIHGHKWKRVQQVVRTRSVTQVRTHAQKYLLKLAKLKGEKKPSSGDNANVNSSSDTESTHNQTQDDGEERSPRKKMRRYDPTTESTVDEEYITAAASTLCFLMRQKIDSLFDSRMEDDKDLEPYDCYSNEQSLSSPDSIESSRKRPYMHFITDNSDEYSYSEEPAQNTTGGSPNGYSIDGKQLCS